MQNKMRKKIIFLLLFLIFPFSGIMQAAPAALETDPSVSSGVLDCGLSYYLVTNESRAGMADFALVRKISPESAEDRNAETVFARTCLDSLPHFMHRSPLSFLAGNGVAYPRDGYVKVEKDAVLYHFRDVFMKRTAGLVDSTMLMLFDIALRSASVPVRDSVTAEISDQAVIVSGDIDKDAVLSKLKMFSLMIAGRDGKEETAPADTSSSSEPSPEGPLELQTAEDTLTGSSVIRATFYGPEIPRNLRGTALSLIAAQFWNEFRTAARMRIAYMLQEEDIPYSEINFVRYSSAESAEQEKYLASVGVASGDTSRVKEILLSVLSDFRMNGLAPDEYQYARNVATRALYTRSIARSMENSSYVRKCADAFVYGSAIVSAKDEAGFFMTSGLPDSTGMRLLNAYVASLLPECASPAGSVQRPVFRPDDTLKLDTGPGLPVKVRKTRRTGISDSDIWHFQNGMTAIYRKMPTDGIIHYSWILNSGYGNVSDMKPGEGAFYSDMLFNGKIGGMNGRDFMRLLAAEGIEMKAAAGLSSTGIYGSAPFNRLGLLLKALQSLSRTYSGDEDAERYFMGCERLRLSSARGEYQSRLTVIDSIMNPGYRYSGNKSLAGLYPDLPQRAEEFYKDLLSRPDDGVLVLVGDMEAYDVKHVLEQYMGGFEVSEAVSVRPWVSSRQVSGWSTYVSEGRNNSMDVVLSSKLVLNSTNYMSAQIVTMAVKDALVRALAGYGLTVRVEGTFSSFPREGFKISVSIVPARLVSLPYSVVPVNYFTSLYAVRSALENLHENSLSQEATDMYKAALLDSYLSRQQNPEFWLKVISERVATGKSLDTGYEEKIAAVTPETVRKVLEELRNGSVVEYIINKD